MQTIDSTSSPYIKSGGRLKPRVRAKAQSGQSLLIALSILFLLGFLGALFASIVVRNLHNASTSQDTISADYFAQAGINYANDKLQNSPLGADWRPPLQYIDTTNPYAVANAAALTLVKVPTNDPDAQWLSTGWARYNMTGGRFLLKVTYEPDESGTNPSNPISPTAKYIRIDSIGRIGVVDAQDPTTYICSPPDLRRKELTAFKPIGIVDYSRFITNKDNRTDTASLGMPSVAVGSAGSTTVVTPGVLDMNPATLPTADPYGPTELPLITTYGSANAYAGLTPTAAATAANSFGGGSLRSNMNLRLYGINQVYLNTAVGDDWEIAGNLTLDQYNSTTANGGTMTAAASYNTLPAQLYLTSPATQGTPPTYYGTPIFPSNDANFTTYTEAIRDGNLTSDVQGYPRQIKRLNPPLIDTIDQATGLNRYQQLTNGNELQTQQYQPTSDFSPATVNINNGNDIQHESLNAVPGRSLRNDWINHQADTGGSWQGSFYNPPGTLITFGPVAGFSTTSPYGVTLVRSDGAQWTSPTTSGSTTTYAQMGQTLSLSYDALPSGDTSNPNTSAQGYLDVNQAAAPNDVVIYASGNIRVRGIVSDPNGTPKHITIVTNGIAYIDGSILKGNPASSIAILAKEYVCLNSTQFLAGATDWNQTPGGITGSSGPPSELTFTTAETLTEHALYAGTAGTPYTDEALYLTESAGGAPQSSAGDVVVNGTGTVLPGVNTQTPVREVISLANGLVPTNVPFDLTFNKDPQAVGDWMLERSAILPGDVKIQAVLYAQDDSFFVIPGDWFNTDPSDTLTHAFDRTARNVSVLDTRYPFYGQPIDLQITVDGAVSENIPADISDQAAWMQKWGWIPRYHGGDTNDVSPHSIAVPTTGMNAGIPQVGVGLNFTYDPTTGFPYTINGSGPATFIRQDRFGRPLAFAPSLPVSPDLLYAGESQGN